MGCYDAAETPETPNMQLSYVCIEVRPSCVRREESQSPDRHASTQRAPASSLSIDAGTIATEIQARFIARHRTESLIFSRCTILIFDKLCMFMDRLVRCQDWRGSSSSSFTLCIVGWVVIYTSSSFSPPPLCSPGSSSSSLCRSSTDRPASSSSWRSQPSRRCLHSVAGLVAAHIIPETLPLQ